MKNKIEDLLEQKIQDLPLYFQKVDIIDDYVENSQKYKHIAVEEFNTTRYRIDNLYKPISKILIDDDFTK